MTEQLKLSKMGDERFEISPMKTSWVLLLVPAYCYFVSNFGDSIIDPGGWIIVLIIIIFPILIWKSVRLFIRLIMFKPAVLLTDESVYIAESGYTIAWADVTDVYLASNVTSYNPEFIDRDRFYIIIKVRDPEKYLATVKNPFLLAYRRLINRLKPSPFEINLTWVRGDEDELFHVVLKYFQNNRGF